MLSEALAKRVRDRPHLPILCIRDLPDKTDMQRKVAKY
jgi:hypothetical protein